MHDKNGFIEYVADGVQYADIKLNVLIKGTHNIIGDVQVEWKNWHTDLRLPRFSLLSNYQQN